MLNQSKSLSANLIASTFSIGNPTAATSLLMTDTTNIASVSNTNSVGNTNLHQNISTIEVQQQMEESTIIEFPEYIRTASTLLCVIILIVGIIGNVLVPIVVWVNKDLRSSTNIFLVNLSLADLLVLVLCVPTGLVELHSQPETWVLGATMCKLVPFAELSVAHASVLTILAISLERYIAICRPLSANYTCTKQRAAMLCIGIWFIGLIATSPVLAIAKHEEMPYIDNSLKPTCLIEAKQIWASVYFLTSMAVFFFIPLFILIVLYWIIARNLMSDPCNTSATTRTIGGAEHPNMKARKQVVIMLATVVFFFFICLLPFRIFYVYIILAPDEDVKNMGQELYYNILYFSRLMLYVNSAINPLLYNVMSSKFREAFFKVLGFHVGPPRGRTRWLCRHLSRQSTFTTNSTNIPSSSVKSTYGFNGKIMSHRHHNNTDNAPCSCDLKELTDSPACSTKGKRGKPTVAVRTTSGPYYPTKCSSTRRQMSSEAAILTTTHPGNIRIIHKVDASRANSVV